MSRDWLWSDLCFLGVLLASMFFIGYGCRKSHHRLAFKRLFEKPVAVSACILLLFFLGIAILDSIPAQVQQDKESNDTHHVTLLDNVLSPLGTIDEKTYSAPLALKAYVTETAWVKGVAEQVYSPLIYPNKTFKNQQAVWDYCLFSFEKALLGSFIL